jgi:hypothetical protein
MREIVPESDITGAQLPGGWYVIVAQRDYFPQFTNDKVLARLSGLGEVVACYVEEHVMSSGAAHWRAGQRVWSVDHDAGAGILRLKVRGEPPPAFAEIHDRLRSEQETAGGESAKVDHMFDVPVELAKSLTGYCHEDELGERPFEVLAQTQTAPKRSWIKRLLGV